MADKELSGLTVGSTPLDGTELHYVVQGGNSRKVTGSDIVGIAHTHAWSSITSTPTTLSGYGITDAQPKDSDLTAIAALSPSDGGFMVGNGTAWTVETGSTARASLGVVIGTDVLAYDADLSTLASLAKTDGAVIIGDGSNWTVESGATFRASVGLSIGTNVQAYSATLGSLSGLSLSNGDILYATGANALARLAKGTDGQVLRLSSGIPAWATASGLGDMLGANNLSDLSSASTSRTNLGLGSAATSDTTDFATAAQGATADTAVQPGDLSAVATSNDYGDLDNLPTLGTAAAEDTTAFATAAQGSLADTAFQPADAPSDPDLSNDTDKLALRGDVADWVNAGTVYKVADRTALKAVDTGAHSAVYLLESGREGQFVWSSADLSTLVTADTEEGVYIAPTSDDTGASGAWVRIHDGELRPEMFGATAITDWDAPEDSTTALAGLASLLNALNAPFKTVLSGFYAAGDALALTCSTLNIEASESGQAGFFFDDCDGISLTQTRRYDGFVFTGVAFITNANNTRTAFSYSGADNTGDSVVRKMDRCAWLGLDRYRNGKEGAATSNLNGWLTEISADQGDRFVISYPVIFGAEDDRLTGFDEDTAGIYAIDSTHIVIEFPWIFFKKTAIKIRGQSENLEVSRGALVANYNGIDCEHDTSPANDHNIIGTHIASFNYDINIGVGGTQDDTSLHNISECLLFTRTSGETISSGFTFIKTNAQCQITNNYFFVAPGLDSVADAYIGVDVQGSAKGCQITGNYAARLGKVVKVGASASHTVISENFTTDNAGSLAVSPIDDSGTKTYVGPNYGDRMPSWPSTSFTNTMWAKGGKAEIKGGALGHTLITATDAPSAVNYIDFVPSATGSAVAMRALGTDTIVDIALLPKSASGRLRFGTHAAIGALTVTGYIEVKDSGGTARKLAVVS
jgi:hypothetical protein